MEALRNLEGVKVLYDFPLAKISWVGTKGKACYYVKPFSLDALLDVLKIICQKDPI